MSDNNKEFRNLTQSNVPAPSNPIHLGGEETFGPTNPPPPALQPLSEAGKAVEPKKRKKIKT